MSTEFNTALTLLGVGMITVFIVLALVVVVGNLLISFINRFVPAEVKAAPVQRSNDSISPAKIKAINEAIDQLTGGKGEVLKIEKT